MVRIFDRSSEKDPLPENSPILITGGTGFVGAALVKKLTAEGHAVIILSRKGGRSLHGAPVRAYAELKQITHARGIINLAGAGIADRRWTDARRRELRESRLETTAQLCAWARQCEIAPDFFISASAIGFYGNTGETAADESSPQGQGFGAELCHDWENALDLPPATRIAILRIGVVIGPHGGALQRMLPAFRMGLGGPLGRGDQWMSWIALDDLLHIIACCITENHWKGVYNAVSPSPVRNFAFAQLLGNALNRPTFLSTPAWVLKLLFGEMSSLLLESQRVTPGRLSEARFEYAHPDLESALRSAIDT